MKSIILNGLSANLKTSIANKLQELHPEYIHAKSPNRFVEDMASKVFHSKYPIHTDTFLLFKLYQMNMLNEIVSNPIIYDKTLPEAIIFNRLISEEKLMYNVNKDYKLTNKNIEYLIHFESEYFKDKDHKRFLILTTDKNFLDEIFEDEDSLRGGTFWDADHYLNCQSEFKRFMENYLVHEIIDISDVKYTINHFNEFIKNFDL